MNSDVLFEIFLHLPVRSLLRFIRVCKFWHYVIDSPHFKYLHTLRLNNNKDEEVYLRFSLHHDEDIYSLLGKKVSINLLDNEKSLKFLHYSCIDLRVVSGAVKGLVCLSSHKFDIVICNPLLGQSKILPLSPCSYTYSQRNNIDHQVVGLGFHEDYKVVQLLSSLKPRCLHANLYLAMTDSWRKLDLDPNLVINQPIKSVCKNGSFAHWKGQNTSGKEIILSFDMKNEVFRTITISCDRTHGRRLMILAKGECSFIMLVIETWELKIYELSCEGSRLIWYYMNNVELCSLSAALPILGINDIPVRRNDNCVVFRGLHFPVRMNYDSVVLRGCQSSEVFLYDYRARKLIGRFKMHESSNTTDDIIEYEGSFLSP